MTGDRAGVDDFPFLLTIDEFFRRRLNTPQGTLNVDAVHFFRRHIGQRLNLGDPGVVHDNIKAAQLFFRFINGGVHLRAIGDVSDEGGRFAPQRFHFGGDGGNSFRVHVDQHHRRAVFGQTQRNTAANALTGAGHQRNFIFDSHVCTHLVLINKLGRPAADVVVSAAANGTTLSGAISVAYPPDGGDNERTDWIKE